MSHLVIVSVLDLVCVDATTADMFCEENEDNCVTLPLLEEIPQLQQLNKGRAPWTAFLPNTEKWLSLCSKGN